MFQKEHTSENVQLDVCFGVKDGTLGKHETSPLCNLSLSGAVVQVRDLSFSREIVTTPLVRTAERFWNCCEKSQRQVFGRLQESHSLFQILHMVDVNGLESKTKTLPSKTGLQDH